MIKVLLIEDDHADQLIFQRVLNKTDFEIDLQIEEGISAGVKASSESKFDIIFCDFNLPDGDALKLLGQIDMDVNPLVVITSQADIAKAIESLKKGAIDFITKDTIDHPTLERIIGSTIRFKNETEKRLKLEKQLEENYANTEAILHNTTDGIWSMDTTGKLLIMNEVAAQNIEEHTDSEVQIGDNFFEQMSPLFVNVWKPMFKKALNGEQTTSIDKYVDGDVFFYLEVACSPIRGNDEVVGVTFFARNVTDREIARYRVSESEKNFRAIFEESDLPILVEALSNNEIIDLNSACAELHGYEKEEMIGMSIYDTIPPDFLETSQKNYQRFLDSELDHLESFVFTKSKESIPVMIRLAQIRYKNEDCNLLFLQDISKRIEMEERLREAKLLAEQSAEFKSQFLANMSHEIRTPLNAIIGFANLLSETDLQEEQLNYVETIEQAGGNLLVIINDILDLSKIQAGKMTIVYEPFDLTNLLEKTIKLHEKSANSKGLEIKLEVSELVPDVIKGDINRLGQILNNLVNNAIKFTESGTVSIVANIDVEDKSKLRFKVSDTGIGIPEDQIDQIFADFSQVDSSVQRKQKGTGLGLSIVRELVRLMGGEMAVNSESGKGSTFSFTLPIELGILTDEELVKSHMLQDTKDFSNFRILLVEDNNVNEILAKKVLEKVKIIPMVAHDGKEGVDLAKKYEFDLILMDIQMPIMDGLQATKLIREFSNVPIYAMTAHVLEEERDKCMNVGMNGFIPKPFKKNEVLELIAKKVSDSGVPDSRDYLDDLPLLKELAEGDLTFAVSLMETYLTTAGIELQNFISGIDKNDFDALKSIAHKLRSSFIIFHLDELKNLSILIEQNMASKAEILRFRLKLEESLHHISQRAESLK